MYIGCHLTIAKVYENAATLAESIGGNVFQFFSRNSRGSSAKELDLENLEKIKKILKENKFRFP